MKTSVWIACVALGLALTACDDDDGGNKMLRDGGLQDAKAPDAGGVNLGVDKTKPVNQLTPTELTQAFKELEASSDRLTEQTQPKLCRVVGVIAALGAEQSAADVCNQAVAACLAPSMPDAGAGPASDDMCTAQPTCSATVGEVEKCMNDMLTTVNAYLDLWPTCASAAAGMGSIPTPPGDPVSCSSIRSKCPDLPSFTDLTSSFGELDAP